MIRLMHGTRWLCHSPSTFQHAEASSVVVAFLGDSWYAFTNFHGAKMSDGVRFESRDAAMQWLNSPVQEVG